MKLLPVFLASLCLGALLFVSPTQVVAQEFDQVIEEYLAGEDSARRSLLEGGVPAIEALEARLLSEEPLSDEEINRLVEQLNADTFVERERASLSLERVGDRVLPLLAQLRGATESPEIRYRLDEILEKMQSGAYASALPDLLFALYEEHIDEIAPTRLAQLEADPLDPAALLFVEVAPRGLVTEAIEEEEARPQILYYLARLYVLHDRAEIGSGLRSFDGDEVLEIATTTYWPHEIEPLSRTLGRWQATYAARVEGTKAHEVITFDLENRPGAPAEDARPALRVSTCRSYILWIYLWRYEPPLMGGPVDNKGAGLALGVLGANMVRLNVVSHIDPDMPLPVVRVSDREKTFWLTGSALEWSRPLMPPEYLDSIRFRQRNYDDAEILSVPE